MRTLPAPATPSAICTAMKVIGTRWDGGDSRIAAIGSTAPSRNEIPDAPAACTELASSSGSIWSSAWACAASASCGVSSTAT